MLVAEATAGSDTNLVIAALLHDAIEDSEVPTELIAQTFGDDVASIVAEVTDDKTLPKAQRKLIQIETAATKSPRAKVLKLADKTSNLRAVAVSPPAGWSVKRRSEYVRFSRKVAEGLRGVDPRLEEQFDEAACAAERSFRPAISGAGNNGRLDQRRRGGARAEHRRGHSCNRHRCVRQLGTRCER
jgi:GTP diphosphokinase / guanosine-3',5'-bis(diphosphate) 3'-diphosphatase